MKRFNDNIFKKFNKTRVEKLESKKCLRALVSLRPAEG